jgi:hypothetical protein
MRILQLRCHEEAENNRRLRPEVRRQVPTYEAPIFFKGLSASASLERADFLGETKFGRTIAATMKPLS